MKYRLTAVAFCVLTVITIFVLAVYVELPMVVAIVFGHVLAGILADVLHEMMFEHERKWDWITVILLLRSVFFGPVALGARTYQALNFEEED